MQTADGRMGQIPVRALQKTRQRIHSPGFIHGSIGQHGSRADRWARRLVLHDRPHTGQCGGNPDVFQHGQDFLEHLGRGMGKQLRQVFRQIMRRIPLREVQCVKNFARMPALQQVQKQPPAAFVPYLLLGRFQTAFLQGLHEHVQILFSDGKCQRHLDAQDDAHDHGHAGRVDFEIELAQQQQRSADHGRARFGPRQDRTLHRKALGRGQRLVENLKGRIVDGVAEDVIVHLAADRHREHGESDPGNQRHHPGGHGDAAQQHPAGQQEQGFENADPVQNPAGEEGLDDHVHRAAHGKEHAQKAAHRIQVVGVVFLHLVAEGHVHQIEHHEGKPPDQVERKGVAVPEHLSEFGRGGFRFRGRGPGPGFPEGPGDQNREDDRAEQPEGRNQNQVD